MIKDEIQPVLFEDLGLISYRPAWDYQEKLLTENVRIKTRQRESEIAESGKQLAAGSGRLPMGDKQLSTVHHLLFCEHLPVVTLGKSGHLENLLVNEKQLTHFNIEFVRTNRGGDITFHGPGQVVGYPIFDLEKMFTDIGKYMRLLEQVIIDTLATFNVKGDRSPGETGVWLEPDIKGRARKICAMGVRCSRWITMHGFALNVNTDLHYFDYIIPCGIQGKQVTSLQKELGRKVDMEEVKMILKQHFEKIFSVKLITSSSAGHDNVVSPLPLWNRE